MISPLKIKAIGVLQTRSYQDFFWTLGKLISTLSSVKQWNWDFFFKLNDHKSFLIQRLWTQKKKYFGYSVKFDHSCISQSVTDKLCLHLKVPFLKRKINLYFQSCFSVLFLIKCREGRIVVMLSSSTNIEYGIIL